MKTNGPARNQATTVAVIVMTRAGDLLLHTPYATAGTGEKWSLVTGTTDPGETPLKAAARILGNHHLPGIEAADLEEALTSDDDSLTVFAATWATNDYDVRITGSSDADFHPVDEIPHLHLNDLTCTVLRAFFQDGEEDQQAAVEDDAQNEQQEPANLAALLASSRRQERKPDAVLPMRGMAKYWRANTRLDTGGEMPPPRDDDEPPERRNLRALLTPERRAEPEDTAAAPLPVAPPVRPLRGYANYWSAEPPTWAQQDGEQPEENWQEEQFAAPEEAEPLIEDDPHGHRDLRGLLTPERRHRSEDTPSASRPLRPLRTYSQYWNTKPAMWSEQDDEQQWDEEEDTAPPPHEETPPFAKPGLRDLLTPTNPRYRDPEAHPQGPVRPLRSYTQYWSTAADTWSETTECEDEEWCEEDIPHCPAEQAEEPPFAKPGLRDLLTPTNPRYRDPDAYPEESIRPLRGMANYWSAEKGVWEDPDPDVYPRRVEDSPKPVKRNLRGLLTPEHRDGPGRSEHAAPIRPLRSLVNHWNTEKPAWMDPEPEPHFDDRDFAVEQPEPRPAARTEPQDYRPEPSGPSFVPRRNLSRYLSAAPVWKHAPAPEPVEEPRPPKPQKVRNLKALLAPPVDLP